VQKKCKKERALSPLVKGGEGKAVIWGGGLVKIESIGEEVEARDRPSPSERRLRQRVRGYCIWERCVPSERDIQ